MVLKRVRLENIPAQKPAVNIVSPKRSSAPEQPEPQGTVLKHVDTHPVEGILCILFPSLCRKKRGEELLEVLPFVREVYRHGDEKAIDIGLANDETRAHVSGQVLHLTNHSLPAGRHSRAAFVALLFVVWACLVSGGMKLRCGIIAFIYSLIEYIFTFLERGQAYTSVAQFWGNMLYLPVLLDVYGSFLDENMLLYILLFPLNIWLLEVVEGHLIMWTYGHNVAWCYLDYADCALNGCVRLAHAVCWLLLGSILAHWYPPLVVYTDELAQQLHSFVRDFEFVLNRYS